jgi:hypothetical protein
MADLMAENVPLGNQSGISCYHADLGKSCCYS